uniref:ORF6 protein n=1 Tax=Psittacine aviadenovirus B TaxID=2169709 RepID=A0AB38ZP90_9ADEN
MSCVGGRKALLLCYTLGMIVSVWLTVYGFVSCWCGLMRLYRAEQEREKEMVADGLCALMNALTTVAVQLEDAERADATPTPPPRRRARPRPV